MSAGAARRTVTAVAMRLPAPISRGARAKQLRPIQLGPVELLLHALEGGVSDRAIRTQRDQTLALRLGRGAHNRGVRIFLIGGAGSFPRRHAAFASGAVARDLILRALQLQLVAMPNELRRRGAWTGRRRFHRRSQRLHPRQPHLSIDGIVLLEM